MSAPVIKNFACIVYSTVYDGKFYLATGNPTTLLAKYGPNCTNPICKSYPLLMFTILQRVCGEYLIVDTVTITSDNFLWLLASIDMGIRVAQKLFALHGQTQAVALVYNKIGEVHAIYASLKMNGAGMLARTRVIYKILKELNDSLQ